MAIGSVPSSSTFPGRTTSCTAAAHCRILTSGSAGISIITHGFEDGGPQLPNLLVVGAPKSGTTTLHRVLSDHPNVYMTRVKEPGFFSSQRHYSKGIDWYASEFFGTATGFVRRGEATPWYLYSRDALSRVASDLASQSPAIVVVLREPVSRGYSMYWDQVAAGHERRGFAEAVAGETVDAERLAGCSEIPNDELRRAYLTAGRYADYLGHWIAAFGRSRVLVIIHEELIQQPQQELERLWRFLDIPARSLSELPRENKAAQPVSRTLEGALRLIERVPPDLRGAIARVLGDERVRRLAARLVRANRRESGYPPLDPGLATVLRERFEPHNVRLEELLGRQLGVWRSDTTDASIADLDATVRGATRPEARDRTGGVPASRGQQEDAPP